MGFSELICYKKESPNCSDRTEKISKITIHHMAGNLSVETCCALLANPARQASANYCIGSDGRIAGMVDENKRSWASSSPWNDQRAITIEVANDELGGNWHVSDKAYESLIKLCVDICKRHHFRLTYDGTQNGSLTAHNMFAATACPGPYLQSKFPEIAKEVNAKLDGETYRDSENEPIASAPQNFNIFYRVKTQKDGWLPEVCNLTDFAGWNGSNVIGVAMRTNVGTIQYRVHILGGGWLPFVSGCDINDLVYGYAGNDKVIDALEAYYFTPDGIPYRKVKYKVNNYDWQYDNEKGNGQDGYAGAFGVPVKELRMEII